MTYKNEPRSKSSLLWRVLGALVLGVILARWSWILLAPHATVTAIAPAPGSAAEAERLFGVAASAPAPSGATALPNVQLLGVFAPSAGRPGFAVLKLDGSQKQVGVAIGEAVTAGVKLLEVHPDHVLLERAGVQQRVELTGRTAGAK